MATLNALDQVRLDAQEITLKRIEEAKEQKKWQESVDGAITLEDERPEEVAVEKTVKEKKGQK